MLARDRRTSFLLTVSALALATAVAPNAAEPTRAQALAAMARATTYMVDTVSTEGGYVWAYLPDRSRRWGEIEARPSMIWIQAPGTATMGHLFLDAYHATRDELYYRAAEKTAAALIRGQHRSGGWNYVVDLGGRGVSPGVVRHRRAQRLATRGVPALHG